MVRRVEAVRDERGRSRHGRHAQLLRGEEIVALQELVNELVARDHPVTAEVRRPEDVRRVVQGFHYGPWVREHGGIVAKIEANDSVRGYVGGNSGSFRHGVESSYRRDGTRP